MSHIAPEPTTSAHTPNHTGTDSVAPDPVSSVTESVTPNALQTGDVVAVRYDGVKVGEATVLDDGSVSVRLDQDMFSLFRDKRPMVSFAFDTEELSVEEGH